MDQEKFGKFIKQIRKDHNLTQKQLAEKYNVTYQAVSKWETGKNMPDISLIKQIAKELVEKYDSKVPTDKDILITFPGIGRKTINVFLSEFYNYPAIAVDTHVERVSKRLNLAKSKDDVLTIEKKLMKFYDKDTWAKRHLQMVLFGRYYCKAKKPECNNCKLKEICKEKKERI